MAAVALVLACSPAPETGPGAARLEDLLPDSLPEGWSAAAAPGEYDADTLYEYLDGGAPLYLKYGFQRLLHTRYLLGEDEFAGLTIDIFDMGSTLGAFGLYSSMRPLDATFMSWGAEGYRSGAVAAAWRGRIFVHGEADEDRPELTTMMENLLAEIAAEAAGDIAPPAILGSLPADGRVPHSEEYVSTDLFGHAFLPGGVLASYRIEDREGQLFFSELESAAAATAALAQLRAHQERWGEIIGGGPSIGAGGFRFSDPGLGTGTAVSAGRFVAGVHGALPPEAQDRLLERLVSRLEAVP